MKLADFIAAVESIAPHELALDFDNVGLLVGTERDEINRVLVALDCTAKVVDEASALGCDIVLTHHPLMFQPIKRLLPDDPVNMPVFKLIRANIGHFAAHTNLDCVMGGVNTQLCKLLCIEDEKPVPPDNLLHIGRLCEPVGFLQLAKRVETVLDTRVRVAGEDRMIQTVCVCGGAGGSEYMLAKDAGADVFVTGECKHNQAIEAAQAGLNVIVGGHYETERIVLRPLIDEMSRIAPQVQFILSKAEANVLRSL